MSSAGATRRGVGACPELAEGVSLTITRGVGRDTRNLRYDIMSSASAPTGVPGGRSPWRGCGGCPPQQPEGEAETVGTSETTSCRPRALRPGLQGAQPLAGVWGVVPTIIRGAGRDTRNRRYDICRPRALRPGFQWAQPLAGVWGCPPRQPEGWVETPGTSDTMSCRPRALRPGFQGARSPWRGCGGVPHNNPRGRPAGDQERL